MPQPKKGPRLGGSPTHHDLMLRNLAQELFWQGRITTTVTRAKLVRPLAETAHQQGPHRLRSTPGARCWPRSRTAKWSPSCSTRWPPAMPAGPGGYTRIVRLGPRRGDGSEMAVIELI